MHYAKYSSRPMKGVPGRHMSDEFSNSQDELPHQMKIPCLWGYRGSEKV